MKALVIHTGNNRFLASTVSRGCEFDAWWGQFFILLFSVNAGRIWQEMMNYRKARMLPVMEFWIR